MNKIAPMKNLDPRTQYVPEKYSSLAADFMATTKQNKEYWNSVKVASAPSSRIAFEELRQVAVFMPLIPVAIVLLCIGKIAAAFAFLVALLMMRSLHLKVQYDIGRKWNEWLGRDQGRYTFTQFMCNEFGLLPQDVTLELVDRMCSHFMLLMKARKRYKEENVDTSSVASHGYCDAGTILSDETRPASGRHSERYENCANQNMHNSLIEDVSLKINPMTGLPMFDDCFDINGNAFGTSNMDDIWSYSNNNGFAASNDFVGGDGVFFADDTGI